MNVARIIKGPVRIGSWPVAIGNEAIATTKDLFVAVVGVWSSVSHVMADATTWDVFEDPLASGWDDVVRRPHAMGAISRFGSPPFAEGRGESASSA